ncbi:MAG TPA: sugar ABC transporter permease [Candidatus Ornithocaccomicrobium faecavium]|uniref:Sugar ABC transporter permease n=1 Tax=Candidatus Ornithocaccomicrobium faecavium TaxID=2840890 RepID=A0A9D1TBV1_9FIRM|nr:sugar ABC transporter permease [Candidatus Ornithocaccomicrobium faecavium]
MYYALALPGLAYFLIFHYLPMYGVIIAFKDYNIYKGIWGSPWMGLEVFQRLFGLANFSRAFWNTVIICLEKTVTGFPLSIILALMLNELRSKGYNKYISTALILPHFISWVVIYGLAYAILSPTTGLIVAIWETLFPGANTPNLLISSTAFRPLMVFLHSWRNVGFASIMYTAAIAGIDPQLYESAQIDGAGRWKQMTNVTLPCIFPTIITMWILRLGDLLGADFDQILTFMNSATIRTGDIIDTFVYRMGLQDAEYSLSTAAGLFKSTLSLVFVLGTNYLVKKYDRDSALM